MEQQTHVCQNCGYWWEEDATKLDLLLAVASALCDSSPKCPVAVIDEVIAILETTDNHPLALAIQAAADDLKTALKGT